jgi:hypothetical protein
MTAKESAGKAQVQVLTGLQTRTFATPRVRAAVLVAASGSQPPA